MTAEADIAAIADGGANTAATVRTALTSILARGQGTQWTTYAGTWVDATGGDTVDPGAGSIDYYYTQVGNLICVQIDFTIGAGATLGGGTGDFWKWSLPVDAARIPTGSAYAFDSSGGASVHKTGVVLGGNFLGAAEPGIIFVVSNASANPWSANFPMTWASPDEGHLTICYESV